MIEQEKTAIAAAIAALEMVAVERECPDAGDPRYFVDYGIGSGHICDLCNGTGVACYPWTEAVGAAIHLLRSLGDGWEPSGQADKNRTYRMMYVPERRMSFQVVWSEEMEAWTTGNTVFFRPDQVTHTQPLPISPEAK